MSGPSNNDRHSDREHVDKTRKKDSCDLNFEVDLLSVRVESLSEVKKGTVLRVVLAYRGALEVAECRTSSDAFVGTISNVEDLGALLRCLRQKVRYEGNVVLLTGSHCRVFVGRAQS